MICSKKGMSELWWIIATAIVALLAVILILVFFKGSSERVFSEVGERIEGLQDRDKDNVADLFDKCPCDPDIGESFPPGITECRIKCPTS